MEKNDTLIQFFQWYSEKGGLHWDHFKNNIDRLKSVGITAAWLPPAYKGTRGAESEGYDVYDIYDLGEFDQKGSVATKYGSKEKYLEAVAAARQAGLQVYVDVVLNHMGGAEETERMMVQEVDQDDRTKMLTEPFEIEAYTRFTFPGRNGKYSTFKWDATCFTGLDHAVGRESKSIYLRCNEYDSTWEPLVHNEKGSFDYLILNDIETRNEKVRKELKNWIQWYYETVPFDGIRLDAVKHINPAFFIEWIDFIKKDINPNIYVIGEYWLSDDLPVLLKYIEVTEKRMSLFDAPLHHNFSEASNNKGSYDLREIFTDSLIGVHPDLAITFVDNHDTQPLQSLEEYTEQWFKPHAYALILLRDKGYPCVFYPDLYGAKYSDKGKDGQLREVDIPILSELEKLLVCRRYLAYGSQVDYFDDPNCIGWVREGIPEKPGSGLAVLLSNASDTMQKKMSLGSDFGGKELVNLLDPMASNIFLDNTGTGIFEVGPYQVGVWIVAEMLTKF